MAGGETVGWAGLACRASYPSQAEPVEGRGRALPGAAAQ